MPLFTDYQRKMWCCLSYLSVCRFYIEKDISGRFHIRKAGKLRLCFYYGLWINTAIKISYLILTYHGLLGVEVHFLDQMSMWDWFLCFSQLIQEVNMWYRKYPLYEVLHANWTVMEDIYRRLGSPNHLQKKINHSDKILVYMHTVIVLVGCSALVVQFYIDPKFALNTYAMFSFDYPIIRIFFAAHEYLYMFHIWVHQASSIVLCEVFAVSYTNILNEMAQVVYQLIELGELQDELTSAEKRRRLQYETISDTADVDDINMTVSSSSARMQSRPPRMVSADSIQRDVRKGTPSSAHSRHEYHKNRHGHDKNPWRIKDRFLDSRTVVPGTEYDIGTLLMDYRRVVLASNAFNAWVGKLMAGTTASNYGQFVSDVFMMIQLLKEPETDFLGVFFFCEDACAGMVMLFRMLILISRMSPASDQFLQAFKCYLQYDMPGKKYLLKYRRSLRKVACKLGGYSTRGITVPKGVNALMNYYIGAAMWKRPTDRRT